MLLPASSIGAVLVAIDFVTPVVAFFGLLTAVLAILFLIGVADYLARLANANRVRFGLRRLFVAMTVSALVLAAVFHWLS
jgi:hypothetical protein